MVFKSYSEMLYENEVEIQELRETLDLTLDLLLDAAIVVAELESELQDEQLYHRQSIECGLELGRRLAKIPKWIRIIFGVN